MYKAIIFDFFDVIRTDAYKAWLQANGFKHEGGFLEASHEQDMGTITVDEFLEKLSKLSGREVTLEEVDDAATVNDDVVAIVDSLHGPYQTALLSNAPSAFLRRLLENHALEQHFDEIIISSEVGMVKPDAKIFALVLKHLGVEAAEAVFVDDNERHTKAAQNIGIHSILFTSAKQLRQELQRVGVKI